MKKFLTFILISFLSLLLFSCTNEPTEEILSEYALSFNDNSKIDLDTGVYTVNPDYCSTGKIRAIFNSVIPDEIQFHYMLLWSTNGYYLGYYIGLGNDDTSSKYLGTYTSGVINSPAEPFYFALLINKSGINSLSPIGSSTYDDLFRSPTFLSYTDSVIGGSSPTGTLADLSSYSTIYYDDVLTGSLQDAFNNPTYTDTITEYNGMTLEDIFYKGGGDYVPQDAQFLTNPNFTTDINNWSRGKCTGAWNSSGYGTFTKSSAGESFGISQNWSLTPQEHIIYMTSKVRSESADITSISLYANASYEDMVTINSPTVNNWYEVYTTFDNPVANDLTIRVSAFNSAENYSTLNYAFSVDYIRAYDLTLIFGSGNEPSADQFNYFLEVNNFNTQKTVYNLGYSRSNLTDSSGLFTSRGIPVLSLTNLIQNGQFTTDTNSDGFADGFAKIGNATLTDGIQKIDNSINVSSLYIIRNPHLYSVIGENYYISFGLVESKNIAESSRFYVSMGGPYFNFVDNQTYNNLSLIFNASTTAYFELSLVSVSGLQTAYFQLDDLSVFNSFTYTKTQIDNALINFGYLPYNVAYTLPDMGASGTGERSFGTCGDDVCFAVNGAGIGTGLEIYDYYTMYQSGYFTTLSGSGSAFDQWEEWRASYGDKSTTYSNAISGINPSLLPLSVQTDFTTDTTARDYYIQLYKDAVNEVERWEWYSAYGITSENYAYYHQLFLDSVNEVERWEWWKDDGITAENYDYYINPLLPHTLYLDAYNEVDRWEWYKDNGITSTNYAEYKAVYDLLLTLSPINYALFQTSTVFFVNTVPLDTTTIDGETYDFTTFKGKTNYWLDVTLGLSDLVINLIALVIMIICLIPLFMFKAQWPLYLIVEIPLFAFFVIMEWFAVWVVIIVVALAILLMYLVMNKQNA